MFSPAYYRPRRETSEVIVYLSPNQLAPTTVPFELQSYMSQDSWSQRIPAIIKTSSRFAKPRLEVFWTIIGFIATLGVPLALYQLIFGYFDRPAPGARRESGLRQAEARALSIGISFGSLLLFSLPIIVWKLIGKRKMKKMLGRWADMDRINSGHTNPIPTWKVRTPAIFKDTITLIIAIPQRSSTSSFHPNAYLPSYINAPVDADANYFYPYKPAPGLPRMSTIGNVPLYLDEKRNYSV